MDILYSVFFYEILQRFLYNNCFPGPREATYVERIEAIDEFRYEPRYAHRFLRFHEHIVKLHALLVIKRVDEIFPLLKLALIEVQIEIQVRHADIVYIGRKDIAHLSLETRHTFKLDHRPYRPIVTKHHQPL